jgi:tetratricopeptide (TPR) repeat protein
MPLPLTCVLFALLPQPAGNAYHLRGCDHYANKRFDDALADLTRAVVLDPSNPQGWHNRGTVWASKKEYEKAVADYTKAHELEPIALRPLTLRGDAWFALKEFDKAIEDYTEAIKWHPRHAEAYRSRGNLLFQQGEFRKAAADHSKLIEFDPKDAEAHYSRGLARLGLGQHADAVADLTKATELDPKDADAWGQLAMVYAAGSDTSLRDPKKAVACGRKAVGLRPTDHRVRSALAAAHAAAGDFDAAVEEQGRALETEGMTEDERDLALWRLDCYKLKGTWWDDE